MSRSRRVSALAYVAVVAMAITFPVVAGRSASVVDGRVLAVQSRTIDTFSRSGDQTRFGKLEYVGGLVMATAGDEMGALSSIRFLPDREHFLAVMDTGYWAKGRIVRGADGRMTAIADFSVSEMIGPSGYRRDRKDFMDAEGLQIVDGKVLVSFEQNHRIDSYPFDKTEASGPVTSLKPLIPPGLKFRHNGGMEALLAAPADSAIGDNLFFVAEKSYNATGDFIAAVMGGPRRGNFYVKRYPPYDVTDGVVLNDGTFLLLERCFSLTEGIGARIRRFRLADIKGQGETIDGETIFDADLSEQIDNMEGIDSFVAEDGTRRIVLISDNNHSLLERNLMLEFKLAE